MGASLAPAELPSAGGRLLKVEGLTLLADDGAGRGADRAADHAARLTVLAVVDDDDAQAASTELVLRLEL